MDPALRNWLIAAVSYVPIWYHKRNPARYGLTIEASEPPDKTKCEDAGLLCLEGALDLLRNGVRHGLVSEEIRDRYPARIWSVAQDGRVFEAKLTNAVKGEYHGFPFSPGDPAGEIIRAALSRARP